MLGRGVSYCGTCDGMLYRGKAVAVVAESAEAVHEANYLAGLAAHVRYFGKPDAALDPAIEVIDEKPAAVEGESRVSALVTSAGRYEEDGVFIFRDAMALDTLLPGLAHDGPFIRVDRGMHTSLAGVFAAATARASPFRSPRRSARAASRRFPPQNSRRAGRRCLPPPPNNRFRLQLPHTRPQAVPAAPCAKAAWSI